MALNPLCAGRGRGGQRGGQGRHKQRLGVRAGRTQITDTADAHVYVHDPRKGWYPQTAHVFRILHLVCIQDT